MASKHIEHCKCKHLITWVFIVAVICQCNATRTNHLRKTEWKFMEAINIGKISAIFFECRLIYSLQAVQRALISSHFFVIAFWFSLFLFSPFVRISTRSHWCIHENAVYIHISFMTYNNKHTYTHTNRGAHAHANEWTIKIDDKISSGCFSTANSRASIHVCDNFDVKERELQFANNANYDAFNHINKKNAFTCKTGPPLRHPS